jgi:DNA-binding CsgD family transcriptional regulator
MSNQTLAVLTLLETAYRTDLEDAAWMRSVVRDASVVLGRGLGVSGYFVDASPDMFSAWGFECTGMDEAVERKRFEVWSELAPVALKRHAHLHSAAAYASQIPRVNIAPQAFQESSEITGHADILGITAVDASAVGCAFAIPCPSRQPDPPPIAERTIWERTAAHFAAALRLRRRLAGTPSTDDVVLSPSGRVEHAVGQAQEPATLARLRDAAARFDRARVGCAARDPLETTELWQALVAGRWSLLDQFERDGRRYIVARPNEPVMDPMRKLTARETQVLRAAAIGHSNKLIAYELGVSSSTVSVCLDRAAKKLGVRDRLELIRVCAARFGPGQQEQPAHDAS